MFPISNLLLKLIFLNFHSLYLTLVIKPHQLPRIFNCFYKILYIFNFKLLWFVLSLLVLKVLLYKLTAVKNTIKRSHLFMAVVFLDGILVHLVRQTLLIIYDVWYISKYYDKIFFSIDVLAIVLNIARTSWIGHCIFHLDFIIFIALLAVILFVHYVFIIKWCHFLILLSLNLPRNWVIFRVLFS